MSGSKFNRLHFETYIALILNTEYFNHYLLMKIHDFFIYMSIHVHITFLNPYYIIKNLHLPQTCMVTENFKYRE